MSARVVPAWWLLVALDIGIVFGGLAFWLGVSA